MLTVQVNSYESLWFTKFADLLNGYLIKVTLKSEDSEESGEQVRGVLGGGSGSEYNLYDEDEEEEILTFTAEQVESVLVLD